MKITCDREKLLAAFQTAAMVAPTRSPKPISAEREAGGERPRGRADGHRSGVRRANQRAGRRHRQAGCGRAAGATVQLDPPRKQRRDAADRGKRTRLRGEGGSQRVQVAGGESRGVPERRAVQGGKVSHRGGSPVPRDRYPYRVRHRYGEQPLRARRRAAGTRRREDSGGGHRWPASFQDGRSGRSGGRTYHGRNANDRPHAIHAAAGSGIERCRRASSHLLARQRRRDANEPGDVRLPPGGRTVSRDGATCSRVASRP